MIECPRCEMRDDDWHLCRWSDCPTKAKPVDQSSRIAALEDELVKAKQYKCPIGMDDARQFCSVGHCAACASDLRAQLTLALSQRGRAVEALSILVNKMDICHADERYKGAWTHAHFRFGPYTGPTYTDEIARARSVITEIEEVK